MCFITVVHPGAQEMRSLEDHEEVNVMKTLTMTKGTAVVLMAVLFAVLSIQSSQSAQAADSHVKGAMRFAPIEVLGAIASGAVEDTLQACLARIPEVASAGQRMLAEQSCAAEEETRSTIQSAPKF